jgi:hypothetical protein
MVALPSPAILATIAPLVCGQRPGRIEVRDHLPDAIREIARKNNLDSATEARVRRALEAGFNFPSGPAVDIGKAQRSVAEALKAANIGTCRPSPTESYISDILLAFRAAKGKSWKL